MSMKLEEVAETFKKRSGCSDVGKLFEDLSIANYILKLLVDENITNFKLSANDDNYGAFDDIILEIENHEELVTFAIQLKHINKRQLSQCKLTEKSGNFSLKKYYDSFKKDMKNPSQLILFSNAKFNSYNGEEIQFEKYKLKICKKDLNQLISTSGDCFQFELLTNDSLNDSPETDEYQDFFKNFFLYTNQSNVHQVENSIKTQFREMFGKSADYKRYIEFVSQWSQREGSKEKLDKTLMQRVITLILVNPFVKPISFGCEINENVKIFREAFSEFNVTLFDEKIQDNVAKLFGDKIIPNDVKKINKIREKYQIDSDYIKNVDEIDDKNRSIYLWLLNEIPLVLFDNEVVYKAIELCKNKKIVLLQKSFKRIKLKNCLIFQNLNDLNKEICDKILNQFKCSIQGNQLINLGHFIKLENDLNFVITTNELVQMLYGPYKIDDKKENLSVPYIERQLTRKVIDFQFLEIIDKSTVILIDCLDDQITNNLSNKYLLINLENFLKEDENENFKMKSSYHEFGSIFVSDKRCENKLFEKLCAKKTELKKCFHFRVAPGDNLEWIRSNGDLDNLERFRKDNVYISEKDSTNDDNNINLIITEAGMGKSELLKHFKNKYFENFWSVLLAPEDMLALCDYCSTKKLTQHLFFDFLLDYKFRNIPNFDKHILKLFLNENKVIFLWDALDELSIKQQKIIIDLISDLSKMNCYQWITSRCHLKQKLEKSFGVLSQKLVPLNVQQQIWYIEKRLNVLNLKNIQEITNKIINLTSYIRNNDILAIPLQIFMITELFLQNSEKYFGLLKNLFSLTDLYQFFIEEKFYLFIKDKANLTASNDVSNQFLKESKNSLLEQYEIIAIETLFPKTLRQMLEINCERYSKIVSNRIGILISEIGDDKIQFVHITFAEFLAANYFFKHFKKLSYLKEIIFQKDYTNVRFFFDSLLAKNSPPHIALLCNNYDFITGRNTDELKSCRDLGGRNLLHLACSWGERYSSLNIEKENQFYIIDDEDDVNSNSESPEYNKFLMFLIDIFDVEEIDFTFQLNAIQYADKANCIFAKIKTLHKQNFKKLDDQTTCNLLYYSARYGYTEALKLFEEIPLIKTKKKQNSLLHLSVHYESYFLKLLKLNKCKQKINFKNELGQTPLHESAASGCDKIVDILLSSGADINISDNEGLTPLHLSASNGYENITKVLLGANNTDVCDKDGNTPLHLACQNGHLKITKLLRESCAQIDRCDYNGTTPLHKAAYYGHDDIVKFLLSLNGIKINRCDNFGRTSLYWASHNGYKDVVKTLILAGAIIDTCDNENQSALHVACFNGHEDVIRILKFHGCKIDVCDSDGSTPLHKASYNNYDKIVDILLSSGAKIDSCDNYGRTSLYWACHNDHVSVAQLLIKSGANIEISDKNGGTALHFSSYNGHYKITEILINAGAIIDICDKDGSTPLHEASYNGHIKIVDKLISSGARVDNCDNFGRTSLYWACTNGHDNVVKFLISSQAKVDICDNSKNSPLHLAAYYGYEKVVRILTTSHADVNACNNENATPLHKAVLKNHHKVAEILLASNSRVDICDKYNRTPFDIAVQYKYENIIALLIANGANTRTFSYGIYQFCSSIKRRLLSY